MKLKLVLLALIGLVAGFKAMPADTVAVTESSQRVTVSKRLVSIVILYDDTGEISQIHRNYLTRTTIASDPPSVVERGHTETLDPKEVALWVESKEQTDLLDFLNATDKAAAAFTAISKAPTLTAKPEPKPDGQ